MSYKVQPTELSEFKKKLREQYEAVVHIETMHRDDKEGLETLLVRGRWLRKRSLERRDQAAKTLRSLSDCQRHLLHPPKVVGDKLRVSIGGEQSKIRRMLTRFDKWKVPYSVLKLAEIGPEG